MATGLNKAILIGNLGRDPELKYVPSGNSVANFTLATGETFKDRSGNRQTRTTWHNIVIWGKLAEVANQYLKKGSQVYLEGRIDNRSYDDKDGNKRYVSEVVVDMNGKMVMLGSRGSGDDYVQPPKPQADTQNTNSSMGASMPPGPNANVQDDGELPF